jgi:acyl-CoA thioester hydrolase
MEVSMSFSVRIYYEDTDAGGVVYYANYLRFFERARTEWLRELGFEQAKLWQTLGIGFVVKHCAVDYLAPARLDDMLTIETCVESHSATRLTMKQHAVRGEQIIASAHVLLVCVDRDIRPCKIPAPLHKVL